MCWLQTRSHVNYTTHLQDKSMCLQRWRIGQVSFHLKVNVIIAHVFSYYKAFQGNWPKIILLWGTPKPLLLKPATTDWITLFFFLHDVYLIYSLFKSHGTPFILTLVWWVGSHEVVGGHEVFVWVPFFSTPFGLCLPSPTSSLFTLLHNVTTTSSSSVSCQAIWILETSCRSRVGWEMIEKLGFVGLGLNHLILVQI